MIKGCQNSLQIMQELMEKGLIIQILDMSTRQKNISIFQHLSGSVDQRIIGKPRFKRLDPVDVIEIFIARNKWKDITSDL